MLDPQKNVVNFAEFYNKKRLASEAQKRVLSIQPHEDPQQDLAVRISKVKQSINRINKLMEELRAVSPKK
jgi:hypothetical protein